MKISNKNLFTEYPIKDGHRLQYVKHPVQNKNLKWVAASVLLPSGYISVDDNPILVEFDEEKECQKACDIHNSWVGWTKEQSDTIIAKSMGLVTS